MKTSDSRFCFREEDVVSFLHNEMVLEERQEFSTHLVACPLCRSLLNELQSVDSALRAAPSATPGVDLAPAVMSRIGALAHRERLTGIIVRLAAGLVLVFFAGALALVVQHRHHDFDLAATLTDNRPHPDLPVASSSPWPPAEAVAKALGWLSQTQEADGHWDIVRWGGQPMYETGITALSLLALMSGEPVARAETRSAAIRQGIGYLVNRQDSKGQFGPDGSAVMYNHSLSTLALLEGWSGESNAAWRAACDKALAFIVSRQTEEGGWGYTRTSADQANTSVTVWQMQVLLRANELGFAGVQSSIDRGMAWLERRVNEDGRMGYRRPTDFPHGYETLTAAGVYCLLRADTTGQSEQVKKMIEIVRVAAAPPQTSPDYYRWYFISAALTASGGERERSSLDLLQRAVLARQTLDNPHAGSWAPSDRWSMAGGRIYATAMAVLALQSS